jgi:hypothetical protein
VFAGAMTFAGGAAADGPVEDKKPVGRRLSRRSE